MVVLEAVLVYELGLLDANVFFLRAHLVDSFLALRRCTPWC